MANEFFIGNVKGRDGENGQDGFSPVITVESDTEQEYILRIKTESEEFLTRNLRGQDLRIESLEEIVSNGDYNALMFGDDGKLFIEHGKAWIPVLAMIPDGEREVPQVIDWVGGEGRKPDTGQYIGRHGFVSDAKEATNLRGKTGNDGVKGESGGITAPVDGFFTVHVDENSDLYVILSDNTDNPFSYDEETGDLYYVFKE